MRNTTHLEILVPTADNQGSPFSPSSFEAFEQFLLDTAGGLSRRADVEGLWRAPSGETMRDRSRSYVVTVDDIHADEIASDIDTYIRRQFRQLASFIELVPTRATAF